MSNDVSPELKSSTNSVPPPAPSSAQAGLLPSVFADPVIEAQRTFRAIMTALARPGEVQPLRLELPKSKRPAAGVEPVLLAVLQTLADFETPVWLEPALRGGPLPAYVGFHCGAEIVSDPKQAHFAVIGDMRRLPDFSSLAQGTLEYPDRSTTLIVGVDRLETSGRLRLKGPGIDGKAKLGVAPWPENLVRKLSENIAQFPLGVDLLLVDDRAVVGLPRTTRVKLKD